MDKDPLPMSVADIKGNIVTDPLLVLDTWKKYCEKLGCDGGGSADQGDRAQTPEAQRDSERAALILDEVRRLSLSQDGSLPELSRPVTWEEVHAAIQGMHAGKAPS